MNVLYFCGILCYGGYYSLSNPYFVIFNVFFNAALFVLCWGIGPFYYSCNTTFFHTFFLLFLFHILLTEFSRSMIFFFCIFHTTAEIFSFRCFIADYKIVWAFSTMTLYGYTFFIYFTYFCCLLYKMRKDFQRNWNEKMCLKIYLVSRPGMKKMVYGDWKSIFWFLTPFENASRRHIKRAVNMGFVVCFPRVVSKFETTHFTAICAYVYFPNTWRCFFKLYDIFLFVCKKLVQLISQ